MGADPKRWKAEAMDQSFLSLRSVLVPCLGTLVFLFLPRLKDYLSKEGERKVAAEEKQKIKLEKLR